MGGPIIGKEAPFDYTVACLIVINLSGVTVVVMIAGACERKCTVLH